jgi:hypothetical protein
MICVDENPLLPAFGDRLVKRYSPAERLDCARSTRRGVPFVRRHRARMLLEIKDEPKAGRAGACRPWLVAVP